MLSFNDDFNDIQEYENSLSMIGLPAYVKQTIVNNEPMWAVHTLDGAMIGSAPNRYIAEAMIVDSDMHLVTLH